MVVYNMETVAKIQEAIAVIQKGVCKRVDVSDNIKVYECKNIIRIDIKQNLGSGHSESKVSLNG